MNYSNHDATDVLNAAYEGLFGEQLDLNQLLRDLLIDCGIDGSDLNQRDLVDAFNDTESAKWFDVQFACSSCIASYFASGECSNVEFVRSLAAIFILSNAIRRGYGEWERSFDFVIGLMYVNKNKCDYMIRMDALRLAWK